MLFLNSYNGSSGEAAAAADWKCAWSSLKNWSMRSTNENSPGLIAFEISACYPQELHSGLRGSFLPVWFWQAGSDSFQPQVLPCLNMQLHRWISLDKHNSYELYPQGLGPLSTQ